MELVTGIWLTNIILIASLQISDQYKPVFLLHGVSVNSSSMDFLANRISQAHPGTKIHNSNAYPDRKSFTPLPDQISGDLGQEFLNFSRAYPGGFNFVAHSQGTLLGRGLIETYDEHNCHNFIAMSGPLAGQYGPNTIDGSPFPYQTQFVIAYNPVSQHLASLSNYWNDPNFHDLYLKTSTYLPYIDNELYSNMSETYKRGFTKLKKMICVGGPQDEVIAPWQSSYFSFIDTNGTIIDYRERDLYKNDSFGLRTLNESGRFHVHTLGGIVHHEWTHNNDVIDQFVLPYLD